MQVYCRSCKNLLDKKKYKWKFGTANHKFTAEIVNRQKFPEPRTALDILIQYLSLTRSHILAKPPKFEIE